MREDRLYLNDILKSIDHIETFVDGQTFGQFSRDEKTVSAVVQKLQIIGEAAKAVSESMKELNPNIPWKEMAGMRDRLIHSYFSTDQQLVWKTVKEDLPALKKQLLEIP